MKEMVRIQNQIRNNQFMQINWLFGMESLSRECCRFMYRERASGEKVLGALFFWIGS